MRGAFIQALVWYDYWVLIYLFTINSIYFLLLATGLFEMLRHRRLELQSEEGVALELSALMPPVSVLAPAHNEAATIRESVRAMLGLCYPEFEIVVINDGSTDETLSILIEEFRLYKSARYFETKLDTKRIKAVYESMDPIPLVVVDKDNGGKADSLNAGINVSRYPLVCGVDADSLLEERSLLWVARPFVKDPDRVIAVGGTIRVANGCGVDAGRVVAVDVPKSWIARFQTVEYLRAFLGGRIAFSALNCLLVISGAFGLFLKSAVIAAGGYRHDTVGEDMELVVRLHHWARKQGKDYRIHFQPDPVCWTEVPESMRVLKRQRNRWQRGTIECMWMHRSMILNPRYGMLGMFAMPYFIAFEMLGPLVELSGYVLSVVGLYWDLFDPEVFVLFFAAAVLYGMILSTASIILEDLALKRYPTVKNLLTLVVAGVLENLGFRQILTVWRAQAFIDVLRGTKSWGKMERTGFTKAPAGVQS